MSELAEVIAGFPGIGKSTFCKKFPGAVSDSDSSKFDKAHFPGNYIKHIEEMRKEVDVVLVSSHIAVRQALVKAGIPFTLVYPKKDCKVEYIRRYMERGSPESFINLLKANWEGWLDECAAQGNCEHIELECGQYLADVL